MSMMNELKKRFKAVAKVTTEVMNSPCCDEDEAAGQSELSLRYTKR